MDQWEEYEAMYIIEDFFPEFGPLKKAEKPDLQGEGIGIEITKAYDNYYNRYNGEFEKYCLAAMRRDAALESGDEAAANKAEQEMREHYDKCCSDIPESKDLSEMTLSIMDNGFHYMIYENGIECKRRDKIIEAVTSKCEKINSGHYNDFSSNALFIYTHLTLNHKEEIDSIAYQIKDLMKKYTKNFDFIILACISEQRLVWINYKDNKAGWYKMDTSKYNERISKLSRES